MALKLAIQHLVRQRPVFGRDLVEQHELGEAVTSVVEAPAVHARDQAAISMLALIEIGRQPAGLGDELGRRLGQIVWKTGGGVDLRIAVEVEPAGVMMRDHMDHQVEQGSEARTARFRTRGQMQAQRGMLVHHDGEPRRVCRCGLNDHGDRLLGFEATPSCGPASHRFRRKSIRKQRVVRASGGNHCRMSWPAPRRHLHVR